MQGIPHTNYIISVGYTVYMETKDDISYGIIPLIREEGNWHVFLINQISRGGDIYWTFPKGHQESGESGEETARRELTEETNIKLEKLDTSIMYEQAYSFSCDNAIINKKALYFIGVASSKAYIVQEGEVKEAGWFLFEEALKRLTYDKAKIMLQKVWEDLSVLP